MTAVMSVMAKR